MRAWGYLCTVHGSSWVYSFCHSGGLTWQQNEVEPANGEVELEWRHTLLCQINMAALGGCSLPLLLTHAYASSQADRQADSQSDRQADRQADVKTPTDARTNRRSNKQTCTNLTWLSKGKGERTTLRWCVKGMREIRRLVVERDIYLRTRQRSVQLGWLGWKALQWHSDDPSSPSLPPSPPDRPEGVWTAKVASVLHTILSFTLRWVMFWKERKLWERDKN